MEKLFKLKENGTAVKTEVVAGVTTFLAMAYILAVNPSMLGAAGMDSSAVFAATAVSAAFATLFMAFFANYPVALASGMGLNAYFAYTVVPQLASQGITILQIHGRLLLQQSLLKVLSLLSFHFSNSVKHLLIKYLRT